MGRGPLSLDSTAECAQGPPDAGSLPSVKFVISEMSGQTPRFVLECSSAATRLQFTEHGCFQEYGYFLASYLSFSCLLVKVRPWFQMGASCQPGKTTRACQGRAVTWPRDSSSAAVTRPPVKPSLPLLTCKRMQRSLRRGERSGYLAEAPTLPPPPAEGRGDPCPWHVFVFAGPSPP